MAALAAVVLGSGALGGSVARADTLALGIEPDEPSTLTGLELSLGLGVLGQSTSGTPLDDHGYDRAPGPVTDLQARLIFGRDRYVRHGLLLRGAYTAGRGFGRQGYGFRFGIADLGYSMRALLPCMSSAARQVFLTGTLGLSGGWADAGTGRGPMGIDENERRLAADELDHAALGWLFGVEGSVHFGRFLVGASLDLRQHFGIDTEADRTFLAQAMLRVGGAFDWRD
ncbi:MAG: hypothetical protein CMN31_07355 [Sandaracinus sp.]|nr:hypothetical protein [Myxococcales bacterium]MAT28104.1 hypothetical protein [Sandaracinus sp.]MBJ71143.1 hypothetical protein [Sandaracinus sp.]